MNRSDTAQCYALVCGAYETTPSDVNIEAWHLLLRDLDAAVALEATRRLCLRDSPFPPRPGEIVAEVKRIRGEVPPTVDAAVGLYFADRDDMHPLVQRAAAKCFFDRHKTDYDRARWEFRNAYEALLYEAEDEARQPSRRALGIEPAREGHRRALAATADATAAHYGPELEDWERTDDPERAVNALAEIRARLASRRAGRDVAPDDAPESVS